MGVTVRELNGWSPVTVTVDAHGHVQSVTVTEPRFSPEDRAVLLASFRESNAPRGAHGHLIADATDPKTVGRWNVELPTTDFAQEALNKAQESYRENYPNADMGTLLWGVSLD